MSSMYFGKWDIVNKYKITCKTSNYFKKQVRHSEKVLEIAVQIRKP